MQRHYSQTRKSMLSYFIFKSRSFPNGSCRIQEEEDMGKEKEDEKSPIAYQNKDITSKVLAGLFKGKSFRVYGLDLPRIIRAEPTNIPAITANELRLDNLFQLADQSVAIVDYESKYKKEDKVKYLNYVTGIVNRYRNEKKECPLLRVIIIYTGDVYRDQTTDVYEIGVLKMRVETAFLSELDGDGIYQRLKTKIHSANRLTEEELMQFIILPLSYKKQKQKERKIVELLELAEEIRERKQQMFVLAGLYTFADKVIDASMSDIIRRMICMNKFEGLIWKEAEKEKQAALKQAADAYEKEKQKAAKRYRQEKRKQKEAMKKQLEAEKKIHEAEKRQIVKRLMENGGTTEFILSIIPEWTYDEVEKMRREWELGKLI
jgi:hypothetical protein